MGFSHKLLYLLSIKVLLRATFLEIFFVDVKGNQVENRSKVLFITDACKCLPNLL